LFQSLIFSYYQNSFSLPQKIFLNIKPDNLPLIKQAVKIKFNREVSISASVNSQIRKVIKLGKLNANQVIENRVLKAEKYAFSIKDLTFYLGFAGKTLTIEGFDVSHHGGKHAVASAVRFSSHGPEKNNYRLFNIPNELSGNDIGSMRHVLERRINKSDISPMPDIILIDGGKLQLDAALKTFYALTEKPPIILSIVKGSKRVRSTETILSEDGIIEMPKDSPGFLLLQQIRDESHRFAIKSNREKKNKSVKKSSLDSIKGLGPKRRKSLMNNFKSIQSIKAATVEDLCKVSGISIKLAKEINTFYKP
jgi:excinuclease ABC subunit C